MTLVEQAAEPPGVSPEGWEAALSDADSLAASEQALALAGDDPEQAAWILLLRTEAHEGSGDLEAVMADYARILEIRPGSGTALCCRAATLSRTGRFTDALVDLAAAIDADAGLKAIAVRDDDFPDLAADPVSGPASRAIVGEG